MRFFKGLAILRDEIGTSDSEPEPESELYNHTHRVPVCELHRSPFLSTLTAPTTHIQTGGAESKIAPIPPRIRSSRGACGPWWWTCAEAWWLVRSLADEK